MMFIIEWLIWFIVIYLYSIFHMAHDNLWWISGDDDLNQFRRLGAFKANIFFLEKDGKKYRTKLSYILFYRIGSVLTHWRDIMPALIDSLLTSFIMAWFGQIV